MPLKPGLEWGLRSAGCIRSAVESLSGAGVGKIIGSVDARGRPIIRLERPDRSDDLLAIVDTGFNGELLMSARDAAAHGFSSIGVLSAAEVAGGVIQQVAEARATIRWLDEVRRVELLITQTHSLPRSGDEPVVLIGTKLLAPHLLFIDFATGTVDIESQE